MRKLIALLTIAIVVTNHASASADDGRTFNGGGGQSPALKPDEIAKDQVKSKVAVKYLAHRKAGGTPADFPGGFKVLERVLNNGQPFDTASGGPSGGPGITPLDYPAWNMGKTLFTQYQAQETNYYCGPASAWVALKWLGAGNNYFGAALTQSNVATSFWLNTANPGGTARGSNWRHTLNSWTDAGDDGWYVVHNYGSVPPPADVASKFALNIDMNYVPIMNVFMTPSRGLLPGWEGYSGVAHYVPGFGYDQYGDYLHYTEVFQPVGLGSKYNITKEFFANIVASYGMIW